MGGYVGGEYAQKKRADLIQALLSGDMQQYYNNVTGAHNRANDYDIAALNQQGGLAFNNAENQNSRNSSLRDALMKLAGQGIGAYFGGPMGAQAGGSLAELFGGGPNKGNGTQNFVNSYNPNQPFLGSGTMRFSNSVVPGANFGRRY